MSGRLALNGTTEIRGTRGEISGAHVSEATALWLQTMASLTADDTVELQGFFRAADGYLRRITRRYGGRRWGGRVTIGGEIRTITGKEPVRPINVVRPCSWGATCPFRLEHGDHKVRAGTCSNGN